MPIHQAMPGRSQLLPTTCYSVFMFDHSSLFVLTYLSAGLGAGVLSGLFGIGGGTIIVPLLLFLGTPIQEAVPLALLYILFTSFSGSVVNWKERKIQPQAVLLMSLASLLGAYLGVDLAQHLSPKHLIWGFALMMMLVLALFFWRLRYTPQEDEISEPNTPDTPDTPDSKLKTWLIWGLTGLIAGLFSALFGVGGGFIMVPLLVIFSDLDLKLASGTSLASTFFIALAGLSQHYLSGVLLQAVHKSFTPLILLCICGLLGAPLGARLNHRLPVRTLRLGFISFVLLVMVYMLYRGAQLS